MKAALYGLAIFLFLVSAAFADEVIVKPVHIYCSDAAKMKKAFEDHNATWDDLSHVQWLFLAGIYSMDPSTPPGLPYGDRAVMAQVKGVPGAMIIFIDGDLGCTPTPIPAILIKMLKNVEAGVIHHEADPS